MTRKLFIYLALLQGNILMGHKDRLYPILK